MTKKQMKILKELYKSDFTFEQIQERTGLRYEQWLEILVNEQYLNEYISYSESIDPLKISCHLNSKGRDFIENDRSLKFEKYLTRTLSILAILISLISLLISTLLK